jgi:poly-gamma-glutamate capsule biosynthesis protein CapA/YwtB (metallophosphatase superfamily)
MLLISPIAPALSSVPVGVLAAGANTGEARLLFVGDLMFGRYVNAYMAKSGFDAPFKNITSYISSADLAIGNLEGPIVPTNVIPIPPASPNQLNLTGNQQVAPALARAGFDVLSVANNHAYDAKTQGIAYTAAALRRAGITPFGIDPGTGQQPPIKEVNGLKLAFLGYTNIINIPGSTGVGYVNANLPATTAKMTAEVAAAKKKADLVIVMMHWGTEYAIQPDTGQRAIAKILVDAGADLVVGAHPHVAQGIELKNHNGRTVPVIYSLGNALFDQERRLELRQGLSLQCIVDKNGVKSARLVPLETVRDSTGYVMNVQDNAAGQTALQRAAQSTTDNSLKWKAVWDAFQPSPGLALAYRRPLDASRSSVENLGIGAPTRVELSYGRLSVSTYTTPTNQTNPPAQPQWQTIWTSDSDWHVTGYSVGDADGDGTPDLVYTLWKHQQTTERPPGGGLRVNPIGGDLLPHIFINSWARGALNPLWHGSPRPAPLLSVAPAPIGKAGKPLLAVLESSNTSIERAPGRLTLWDWTGGFGYELSSTLAGTYSEMWSDGRELIFR